MLKIPLPLCFLYSYGRSSVILFLFAVYIQIFLVSVWSIHFDKLRFDSGIGHF